mmetsp:Transcript_36389/g.121853  ORF Transcript_36389/g.121853 Transcript_36389/m.121853 type:complete len:327 (+) Transcript_36389:381-1361(+)
MRRRRGRHVAPHRHQVRDARLDHPLLRRRPHRHGHRLQGTRLRHVVQGPRPGERKVPPGRHHRYRAVVGLLAPPLGHLRRRPLRRRPLRRPPVAELLHARNQVLPRPHLARRLDQHLLHHLQGRQQEGLPEQDEHLDLLRLRLRPQGGRRDGRRRRQALQERLPRQGQRLGRLGLLVRRRPLLRPRPHPALPRDQEARRGGVCGQGHRGRRGGGGQGGGQAAPGAADDLLRQGQGGHLLLAQSQRTRRQEGGDGRRHHGHPRQRREVRPEDRGRLQVHPDLHRHLRLVRTRRQRRGQCDGPLHVHLDSIHEHRHLRVRQGRPEDGP